MGHTKCGMTQIGHPDFPLAHGIAQATLDAFKVFWDGLNESRLQRAVVVA